MFPVLSCVILVGCICHTGSTNVAFSKHAEQSSNSSESERHALKAVDGNIGNNNMSSGSCFSTKSEYSPWWKVDLGALYAIDSVVIHNRLDCCSERARNISLDISYDETTTIKHRFLEDGFDSVYTFIFKPPVVGRYVLLTLSGITDVFHLCEVQVMSSQHSAISNVALNKSATMSSDFDEYKWLASAAVDGGRGRDVTSGLSLQCFKTRYDNQPWLRLDLEGDYEIVEVIVYDRYDCCAIRAGDVMITTGTNPHSQGPQSYAYKSLDGVHAYTIYPAVTARYVKLQLVGMTEYFHLCEVEVYGTSTYTS